jgi:hypothetical protein
VKAIINRGQNSEKVQLPTIEMKASDIFYEIGFI